MRGKLVQSRLPSCLLYIEVDCTISVLKNELVLDDEMVILSTIFYKIYIYKLKYIDIKKIYFR
jgi:hypothetical protein